MRKVSVALEADVAGFIKNVLAAEKSVDDLGDKVDKLDHELEKIPPDAGKAGAALKLLDGDVKNVSTHVNDLGEKNTGLAVLDAKIRNSRAEVKKLADEFVKTGNVDVFQKLGQAEGNLRSLQAVRKKLADAIELGAKEGAINIPKWLDKVLPTALKNALTSVISYAKTSGEEVGKVFSGGITGALSTPVVGPVLGAVIVAALVASLDALLANIGGLLLAGSGLGAIGLGIAGAIMGDPEVVGKAWKNTISGVKQQWLDASTVFRGPLLDAAHEFAFVLGGIHLDQILGKAATYLPGLTTGVSGFIREFAAGFQTLVEGAGPALKVLGDELPRLGHAFNVAAKAISDSGDGGARALKDLLSVVEILIAGFGALIGKAEELYGWLAKLQDRFGFGFALPQFHQSTMSAARSLKSVGDAAGSTVDDLGALQTQMNRTAVTADTLAGAMVNKLFTATMNLDQATLGVAESLTRLDESFQKNGKSIDIHTAKGQANREMVLASVTANMQQYQSNIAVGMSAEDATKQYEDNTAALERNLRKAGLTAGQIDELIGKYRNIPADVDRDITFHGLTQAINDLNTTLRLINGIKDKTVTITVKQAGDLPKGQSRGGGMALGGIRRAAVGMVIPPSDPGTTLVGEPQTGGEVLVPLQGIPTSRAISLTQVIGDAYGFTVSPIQDRYASMRSAGQMAWSGSGGGGMQTLRVVMQYPDGRVIRDQVVEWNGSRGRTDPATFFLP